MYMIKKKLKEIINDGICTGCGACVACDISQSASMCYTKKGPIPKYTEQTVFPDWMLDVCPGKGINYPKLYQQQFNKYPDNWLTGIVDHVATGYSLNENIRLKGASGGILTQVLIFLLESKRVDAVIIAHQGIPNPQSARAIIAFSKKDIIAGMQSIYIPVSMLDIIKNIEVDKKYAMVCLPEQSAALRVMQQNNLKKSKQIKYILGPYTGTAIYPDAIEYFLKANKGDKLDEIISLKWRAGKWPGYLEILTKKGKIIRSPKIYYNFLIPFFITQTSLQSMDFTNEFSDLAVGDAWSPKFESQQDGGYSIVVSRNIEMSEILKEMQLNKLLDLTTEDINKAIDMHGHMIDFKKRGGYLRNKWRKITGRLAPDYGYKPLVIPFSRIMIEIIISTLFIIGHLKVSKFILTFIPQKFLGPIFNLARLRWKAISKPTKRIGLRNFQVTIIKDKK